MSRSIPSIKSAALGIVCAVALAGCGAGQITQTDTQLSAVDGASGNVGQVAVRDASIVFAQSENAAIHSAGGTAPLQGRIVNFGAVEDKLVGASSPVAASVQVSGTPVIASGRTLVITGQAPPAEATSTASAGPTASGSPATSSGAAPSAPATATPSEAAPSATVSAEPLPAGTTSTTIVLTGLKQDIRAGLTYPVVFRFEKAGDVTVQIPVANPTAPRTASPEGGSGSHG